MSRKTRRKSRPVKQVAASPEVRRRPWSVGWVALGLLVAALIAFGPAARAPFDFDDLPGIVHNSTIERLWPLGPVLATPGLETAASGRPIVNLSFAINAALNRRLGIATPTRDSPAEAESYRLVNIAIHVCSALLLFLVVRATLARGRIAESWRDVADPLGGAVAVMWLVHPLQTEAVDYIVQRTELLASSFVLLTVFAGERAWHASVERRPLDRRIWVAVSVMACSLGVLSKETAVVAPVILFLYDTTFVFADWRESVRNRGRLYLALIATWAVPLVFLIGGARAHTAGFASGISPLHYAAIQGWAV